MVGWPEPAAGDSSREGSHVQGEFACRRRSTHASLGSLAARLGGSWPQSWDWLSCFRRRRRRRVASLPPCSEILVDLPYALDFASDQGGVVDRDGVGTGFTYVDPPTNGAGYIPENLFVDTAAGLLRAETTAGLSLQDVNSGDNALAVGIDAPSQVTRIEATLDNPLWTGGNEQAGLWFGNDEDNYIKLVVVSTNTGPRIQLRIEQGSIKQHRGHNYNRGPRPRRQIGDAEHDRRSRHHHRRGVLPDRRRAAGRGGRLPGAAAVLLL